MNRNEQELSGEKETRSNLSFLDNKTLFDMPSKFPNSELEVFKINDFYVNENLFIIPDDADYLLYVPFEKCILKVNRATVRALQDFDKVPRNHIDQNSNLFKQLLGTGILISRKKFAQRIGFKQNRTEFDPEGVSLFLTNRCSMRCIYCYASGGNNARTMKWETAKASIDWIIHHVKEKGRNTFYITFHGGGEVTTVPFLMKKCVMYIRNQAKFYGLTARIDAGLNGVMNRQMVDWVIQNLDGATVSLDGLPEFQNYQRPLANNKGSFIVVSETLHRLDSKKFKYAIRATVTNKSLEKLEESVELIFSNFKTKCIQVEPFFMAGRALYTELPPVDPIKFVEKYRKAHKLAKENGHEIKYSGARLHTITNTFCKAAGNSFAITPEGFVTSCFEVTDADDPRASLFFIGRFNEQSGEFLFNNQKIQKLKSLTVENKPYCKDCFCKWHCAGDCPAKLSSLGSAWDTSTNSRCYINRELTKDQLKECLV